MFAHHQAFGQPLGPRGGDIIFLQHLDQAGPCKTGHHGGHGNPEGQSRREDGLEIAREVFEDAHVAARIKRGDVVGNQDNK